MLLPIGRGPAPARGCFPSRGTRLSTACAGRPSAEPLDDVPAAESRYAAVEALELLRFLDEGEREVVILCVYTALPYKELAALLGITVPAAQKRYQRAMKKLRAL